MPRLLVLHTGGTLMMNAGERALRPDAYGRDLVAELPSLRRIAELDVRVVSNLDSGDMQPTHWVDV